MGNKVIGVIVISLVLSAVRFCPAAVKESGSEASEDCQLRVHLPREIAIEGDAIRLGQVGVIMGEESLVAKASEIGLGRISVPGQEIVLKRPMVLSRLACNGIAASDVTLTGAEKVVVTQKHRIIESGELVERALDFVGKNLPAGSVCEPEPTRVPAGLVVPKGCEDIELSPRLAAGGARNHAKVEIGILARGEEIDVREVTFRIRYDCRRAVALVDIAAGEVITPENVKIENGLSNRPEPADWQTPYGLIARRRISAGDVLGAHTVRRHKPVIVIERNQAVMVRFERPGLLVTAMGKAMEDGAVGEYVKVRNVDSQRIILARVNEDGTVEPVL
ncbi:MAG: flagellar basal body P-ring formation chaperone FlgA [Planctomycetota bacterium]|jgi:flagella basal body P-ring formation protein FlgA